MDDAVQAQEQQPLEAVAQEDLAPNNDAPELIGIEEEKVEALIEIDVDAEADEAMAPMQDNEDIIR